jgi:hypothetical protein
VPFTAAVQRDAFAFFDNLNSIYAYEGQAFVRINAGTGTITFSPTPST